MQGKPGAETGSSRDTKDLFPFSCVLTKVVKLLTNVRTQRAIGRLFRLIIETSLGATADKLRRVEG